MTIQRTTVIVAAAISICLAGFGLANAKGWGGGYGGYGCMGYGPGYQQLDDATKAKVDAFLADTTALRKQIAMKQAERRAIMQAQTPDASAAAQVAGELFDLRAEMHSKAKAAGVPMLGGRCMMQGQQGPGQGMMRSGRGMMGPGQGMMGPGNGRGRDYRPCQYQVQGQGWN